MMDWMIHEELKRERERREERPVVYAELPLPPPPAPEVPAAPAAKRGVWEMEM